MKPVQVWRIAFVLILQQLQGLSEGIYNLKSVADTADLLIQRGNERGGGWGYEVGSERGPFKWGNMSSDWALCSTGKQQSPIRILSFDVAKNEKLRRLHTLYHYAPATLLNDGRILRLKWEGGFLLIEESLYELFEVQFHTPSEHTINGKKYAMEMQLMHRNRVNNAIAVVAILFKLGEDRNKFLDQFWQYLPSLKQTKEVFIQEMVDPKTMDLHKKHYYRYVGSLTSPPCTEGVLWTVMKKIHKLSAMQLDLLTAISQHDNARPVQSTNGRIVYKRT